MRFTILGLLLVMSGCSDGTAPVSSDGLGDAWPLTVDRGSIGCDIQNSAFFQDESGTRWGLNGVAAQNGYSDIAPIWADAAPLAPGLPPLKKNIGPLLDPAVDMCD